MKGKRESELKFTCELEHSRFIKQGIESVCIADSSFKENIISSVYFDTDDWLFAMEKASSDFLKTKVRLRWYQPKQPDKQAKPSDCFLEFKRKVGSKRVKHRVLMPFKGDEAIGFLRNPEYRTLIQKEITENVPELLAYCIEPKFVVRYLRNRYTEPFSRTRISFDTDIQAFSVARNFALSSSKIELIESVLEVKGVCDDLPTPLRTLHAGKLKKAAFSKYYESFKLLTGYQQ